MISYLFPSSPWIVVTILVALHCLPIASLGLLCKFYILLHLLFALIGFLFSGKSSSNRSVLTPTRSSYALVTGASSGIGAQLCRQLAGRNFNLILVARSRAKLEQTAEELRRNNPQIKVDVVVQDLTETSAVEQLITKIEALGERQIDLLINNAGRGSTNLFLSTPTTEKVVEEMIALHVTVPTFLIRHYLPKMLGRPSRIVNVSSIISFMSSPRAVVYASTKSFLTQFSTAIDYEIQQIDENRNVSLLLATPGPTLNTGFDRHDQSLIFRFPFVTLTAEDVARRIVDASLRGDRVCIPGWANQLTVWLMTKVPLDFANFVCWVLWASWPELKAWLHQKRHLVLLCANLCFLLVLLVGFITTNFFRQFYFRFLS